MSYGSSSVDQTTVLLFALVLVLLVVLAWWYMYGSRHGKGKNSSTQKHPGHGKGFTGLHSQWHLGSEDAGYGGSMHRNPTIHNQAAQARVNPNYPTKPICPPGQSAVAHTGPSGQVTHLCVDQKSASAMQCGGSWDPESVAQAQTLSAMGSLDPSSDPKLAGVVSGRRGRSAGAVGLTPHSSLSA